MAGPAVLSVGAGILLSMSDVEPPALAAVLAGEDSSVRRAVQLVGQILTGSVTTQVTLAGFLHAMLGRSGSDLVCESRRLSSIGHVAAGLALAALIDRFDPPIGPSDDDEPPTWAHIEIGDKHLAPPARLSAFFTAGQLAPAPVVVRLSSSTLYSDTPRLQVYTTPADRGHAVAVIEAIMTDADGAKNLYRGRALTASENNGLVLEVTDIPTLSRTNVIVPESVWEEIDLNIAALTTHRQLMTQLGLGVRRGILLAGPPGVGKTAISQTIAAELVGPFTVINVDARAGKSVLSAVYKEARALGPTVIVLEDIDLIVGNRRHHGEVRPLSEFLAVMDTDPSAPILTLASTNDVAALDAAAIRTARFDSIIEIGYPTREAAAQILTTYLRGIPGAESIDASQVAAHFNAETNGADIREIVRRTVLATGTVSETALLATIRSGRFKPELPQGNYL